MVCNGNTTAGGSLAQESAQIWDLVIRSEWWHLLFVGTTVGLDVEIPFEVIIGKYG